MNCLNGNYLWYAISGSRCRFPCFTTVWQAATKRKKKKKKKNAPDFVFVSLFIPLDASPRMLWQPWSSPVPPPCHPQRTRIKHLICACSSPHFDAPVNAKSLKFWIRMTAQYSQVRYLGENWKRAQSYDLSAFVTILKKVCEGGKTLYCIKKKVHIKCRWLPSLCRRMKCFNSYSLIAVGPMIHLTRPPTANSLRFSRFELELAWIHQ